MSCSTKVLIGLGCMLCVASSAFAASVKVEVSSRSITDDDDVQVTFTFEGQGQGELPNLDADWRTVGTSQQLSTNFVNGRMYRNRSQTLVLRPKRQGKLTIGAAKVMQGGRVVAQSAPVQVVVRGLQPLLPSESVSAKNLTAAPYLLVPRIARDVQYVGEPFVVEYILLIQEGKRVTDFGMREVEYPSSIQRDKAMEERFERVGERKLFGKTYAQAVVSREVWRVLQPEVITAPSQRLVIETGGRGFNRNRKTLKAPPLKLDVRPVPVKGRPPGYREGAIGRFTVAATLTADDDRGRAVLDVKMSGTGSLRTLDPPKVEVTGATVQELPMDNNVRIDIGKAGVTGEVHVQYLLTPERVGTVFVKPMTLTYFDPTTGRFDTATTEQLTWNAKTAGPQRVKRPVREDAPDVPSEDRTFRPIETERAISSGERRSLPQEDWFPFAVVIPAVLFVAFEIVRVGRRMAASGAGRSKKRRAGVQAQKRLLQAEGMLGKAAGAEVYAEIAAALYDYVRDKHDVVLAGSTKRRIAESLVTFGYDDSVVSSLTAQLEACDAARFAPGAGSETELKAALTRARELIDRLEAQK